MKLQYLIIIFLLIMAPIYIVFSKYIDTQMNNINIQTTYDSKLERATYDAVKAFQVNTTNSSLYTAESRVKYAKASVNSFYTSLNLAFGFNGENAETMKEYVPAVVFTMYDGYYIYSPFENRLTNIEETQVADDYKDGKTLTELKPFISYSCNYTKDNINYIITYSLDNYIVVDEFKDSKHKRYEGYLMGLNQFDDVHGTLDYDNPEKITSLKFNGITFSKDGSKETLKEYLIDENGNGRYYYYTISNGTKYYYSEPTLTNEPTNDSYIFYLNENGDRVNQRENYANNKNAFLDYYNEIKENNLAFEYYRDAYVFSKWVQENLQGLDAGDSIKNSANYDGYSWVKINNIFDIGNTHIEDSDSKFNQHRRDVIRAVIQTNLSAAISGFSTYSKSSDNTNFIMPKISEEDWDLLENNVCMATFLQGFAIGGKTYNNYAVVPNTLSKEYVDEDDIYILKNDKTYSKVNEDVSILNSAKIEQKSTLGFYPGVWKINFETRKLNEKPYIPVSDNNGNPYLKSYSSIMGSGINSITYSDMYKYIRGEYKKEDETAVNIDTDVKKAYYIALGRERQGSYKSIDVENKAFDINLINQNSYKPGSDPEEEEEYKPTYTVKYIGNGATSGSMSDDEHVVGESFSLKPNQYEKSVTISYNLNRPGKNDTTTTITKNLTFVGWATEPDREFKYEDGQEVDSLATEDGKTIKLYAYWTWNLDAIDRPNDTTMFVGWSYSDGTYVNFNDLQSGQTIYALWATEDISKSYYAGYTRSSSSTQSYVYYYLKSDVPIYMGSQTNNGRYYLNKYYLTQNRLWLSTYSGVTFRQASGNQKSSAQSATGTVQEQEKITYRGIVWYKKEQHSHATRSNGSSFPQYNGPKSSILQVIPPSQYDTNKHDTIDLYGTIDKLIQSSQ